MMRPSVQGVDPPVCCTPGCYCYICKRQLCGFTGWVFCLLEGGPRYPGCYCYICKRQFLWIHRLGLCPLEGGPRYPGTSLTVPSSGTVLGHLQVSLQCHFSRCKVGSLKGLRVRIVLVDAFTDLMRCRK